MLSWPSLLYIFWADLQGWGSTEGAWRRVALSTQRHSIRQDLPHSLPVEPKIVPTFQTIQHINFAHGNMTLHLAMLHHIITAPTQLPCEPSPQTHLAAPMLLLSEAVRPRNALTTMRYPVTTAVPLPVPPATSALVAPPAPGEQRCRPSCCCSSSEAMRRLSARCTLLLRTSAPSRPCRGRRISGEAGRAGMCAEQQMHGSTAGCAKLYMDYGLLETLAKHCPNGRGCAIRGMLLHAMCTAAP